MPVTVTCMPVTVTCMPVTVTCMPVTVTCMPVTVTCMPVTVTCMPVTVTCMSVLHMVCILTINRLLAETLDLIACMYFMLSFVDTCLHGRDQVLESMVPALFIFFGGDWFLEQRCYGVFRLRGVL
jgi:hypothetical protein